jgi:hypothetical protein
MGMGSHRNEEYKRQKWELQRTLDKSRLYVIREGKSTNDLQDNKRVGNSLDHYEIIYEGLTRVQISEDESIADKGDELYKCSHLLSIPGTIQRFKIVFWFGGTFFLCSCCSQLEHRACVKRFFSLQFLNLRQSVGLLGRGISPSQGRYLTQNKHIRIHTLSGIRTHDPSVRAGEDILCLRPHGHCHRPLEVY